MSRNLIAILRGVEPESAPSPSATTLVAAGIDLDRGAAELARAAEKHRRACRPRSATAPASAPAPCSNPRRSAPSPPPAPASSSRPTATPASSPARKALGLGSYPGVFTASECFAALAAGADALKIFPAGVMGRAGLAAIRAVLPPTTLIYAVGGVGPADFAAWLRRRLPTASASAAPSSSPAGPPPASPRPPAPASPPGTPPTASRAA